MKTKTFHFLTNTTDNNSDQGNGQARVTIPRTITIGGQEMSIADNPELANLVALVRQDASIVERTKLYPSIDKLKKDLELLSNAEIINPTGNADAGGMEKLISGLLEAKFKSLTDSIDEKINPLLQANQKTEAATVEAYRSELLNNNLGKCIPELVVGSTREELDAALTASLSSFDRLKEQFGVKTIEEQLASQAGTNPTPAGTATPASTPQTVVTPAPASTAPGTPAPSTATTETVILPSSPANTSVPSTDVPNVSAMDMKEFSARREELAKNLQSLMGT